MSTHTTTRFNWVPVVQDFLQMLLAAGCTKILVDDGDDQWQPFEQDAQAAAEAACAVDESFIKVTMPDGLRRWIQIVLGNDPDEIVCDYQIHHVLDAVQTAHSAKWEGVHCPTIEA